MLAKNRSDGTLPIPRNNVERLPRRRVGPDDDLQRFGFGPQSVLPDRESASVRQPASFNFDNPEDRAKLIDKTKKIGTQGYCMGGSLVVRTAAAVADRIGAGASFHGGGLVTDNPNSPHLLAPKIKARMYFGIAANDD